MNLIIKFLLISALLLISSNRSIETIDTQSKKDKKPNIIFILSDDHTTNAISAYGSIYKDIAPTPNIDRIAKEGAILNISGSTYKIHSAKINSTARICLYFKSCVGLI